MSATATTETTTGQPQLLATYDCDEGQRQLVGQRVDGTCTHHRLPPGGRAYLVEEGLTKMVRAASTHRGLHRQSRAGWATPQCKAGFELSVC